MRADAKKFFVEFNDAAPVVVASLAVASCEPASVKIPGQTVSFQFYKRVNDGSSEICSPVYFLSASPEIDTAKAMIARYPAQRGQIAAWQSEYPNAPIAKIELPASSSRLGYLLVPLTEHTVILDRNSRLVLWPGPGRPLQSAIKSETPKSPSR